MIPVNISYKLTTNLNYWSLITINHYFKPVLLAINPKKLSITIIDPGYITIIHHYYELTIFGLSLLLSGSLLLLTTITINLPSGSLLITHWLVYHLWINQLTAATPGQVRPGSPRSRSVSVTGRQKRPGELVALERWWELKVSWW